MQSDEIRRLSTMVDYLFGRGVSRVLPKEGYRFTYSRKSGRLKLVFHAGRLLTTIKPNGSMALSLYGASILAKSARFKDSCVRVSDEAAEFVVAGKSVFCKFVMSAGKDVRPKGEVAVVDEGGRILGVGVAVLNGKHMSQFKSGVAVKVRAGLKN